jgi:hypothetical protein
MRLNVGKYGTLKVGEEEISEVNEEVDMSEKEYENTFRGPRRNGGGNFRRGGSGGGYYNNQGGRGRPPRDDF